jgi:hypothetical protein
VEELKMITKYKDYSCMVFLCLKTVLECREHSRLKYRGIEEASKIKTYVIKVQSLAQVTDYAENFYKNFTAYCRPV